MDIKAVAKNVLKKGLKETVRIHKVDKEYRQVLSKTEHDFVWREDLYIDRPFNDLSSDGEKKAYFDILAKKEKTFEKQDPKAFKKYRNDMKALYVKKRIPELYAEASKRPVENKVIFMENGNSPSPSSSHIAKVMKMQMKYRIIYCGLHIRAVSWVEYYENALKFIEEFATSKAVFLSTANDLLSHFTVRPETKVIQLWHGVGVFKKVGYSTLGSGNFGRGAKDRAEYDQYRNYSYVTIPAPEQSWIFEESMRIDKDSGIIVPVGVSRTDVFYDKKYLAKSLDKLHSALPQTKGKKIILYAPTFRGNVGKGTAPDKLDIDALGNALSDEYVLLIKHHGLANNVPPIPEKWRDSFAFDMGAKKILGIERLLAIADICITDYSSIAFEFAIMERPIIFFAYDLEDYIDERGMYYNYDEITPGPVCKTNEEMIDYIEHIDERFDKQEITDFKHKYVGCCDGHSTERTIALIEK